MHFIVYRAQSFIESDIRMRVGWLAYGLSGRWLFEILTYYIIGVIGSAVQDDISTVQTMLSTSRLSARIYRDLINFMPAKYLMNSCYSSTNEP